MAKVVSRRITMFALAAAALRADPGTDRTFKFAVKSLGGEVLDSASLKGKPVLLQFWASWCTFCQSDEGPVEAVARKFAGNGLVVIGVNAYEPRLKVQEYLAKHPRTCKVALLEETNLASVLTGRTYPVYMLIDRQGNLAGTQTGAQGEQALRRLLQKVGL